MKKIHKLLFANRGEIAMRAMRAATEQGMRSVATCPGYGHVSENTDVAAVCADSSLVFVGPTPIVMRNLDNMVTARDAATGGKVEVKDLLMDFH